MSAPVQVPTLPVVRLAGDWGRALTITPHERQAAMPHARGRYQMAFLWGSESVSGNNLRGTARSYGGSYARARAHVAHVLRGLGVELVEVVSAHGRRSWWSVDALAEALGVPVEDAEVLDVD